MPEWVEGDMRYTVLVAGGLLLLSHLVPGPAEALDAKAELRNAQGETVASAALSDGPDGVWIELQVFKLRPGPHGFHIHEVGKCDPPAFTSAGGHFNPYGKRHGLKNPEGSHAGDLPNLVVGPDGTAKVKVYAKQVTAAPGQYSVFLPAARALVIHADPDDEKTDPAGNAGARIACGVVTR